MSNESVCNYWCDETTGEVTSSPYTTHLIHGTGYIQTPTLATMFTKAYEMKYLAGVLAGNQMVSEGWADHTCSMVGAYPINEQFRHINAFIRGCREVDPLCKVAVVWQMSFNDPYTERAAGKTKLACLCIYTNCQATQFRR